MCSIVRLQLDNEKNSASELFQRVLQFGEFIEAHNGLFDDIDVDMGDDEKAFRKAYRAWNELYEDDPDYGYFSEYLEHHTDDVLGFYKEICGA